MRRQTSCWNTRQLIAETTHSAMDAPRDDQAVAYMRERLSAIRTPPPAQPEATDPSLPQYPGEL